MTIRDIGHHLTCPIGTNPSHETISKITDKVLEDVLACPRRQLKALYPGKLSRCPGCEGRRRRAPSHRAAHIAVAVDMNKGNVLGIWVQKSRAPSTGPGRLPRVRDAASRMT